ncbi:MAG: beta-eliminating lyase-related protein [Eubacteriales bacterium]|nr:beta-eliminating lyase-related protein [Eubacteriales bacterium]
MLFFDNDYAEGAHEKILQRLIETNREQTPGYGLDPYSESAREKIRAACNAPQADIFFLVGGTQTNATVIDSMLRGYEGVIAAQTGHVSAHEAGAIESSGHKVLVLPSADGKISAAALSSYLDTFERDANHDHMVWPGLVYLSYPTEYGTLYTKEELTGLSRICHSHDLPLYLDGARLGYGLASDACDLTFADLAGLCDVFYIGGTKIGALFGEAVVFPQGNAPRHFFTTIKQHGALLAKGRVLGIQFDTLFTDNLYLQISRNAIDTAAALRHILLSRGFLLSPETPTNQIFVVLEDEQCRRLQEHVSFSFWEKADETHTVVRFATSWATRMEDVEALERLLTSP